MKSCPPGEGFSPWLLLLTAVLGRSAFAMPRPPEILGRSDLTIRVRLSSDPARFVVRGFDLRFHESASSTATRKLAGAPARLTQWRVSCAGGMVQLSSGAATYRLKSPVDVDTPGGFVSVDERPYRDAVRVHALGSRCEVVNEVNLEKYLEGLVNAEFSSRWSEEAIAAQVVAARTYAYHQILTMRSRKPAPHYDVDATVRDQVYDGSMREDFRSSRVVERTRGMVLTIGTEAVARKSAASALAPIKAFYHSTCGGRTELPEKVWGSRFPGFKRTVPCPFCQSSPRLRWNSNLDSARIAAGLKKGAESEGVLRGWPRDWAKFLGGRLVDLRIGGQDVSGRVDRVRTLWSQGPRVAVLEIPAAKFRDWMGAGVFRSTAFGVRFAGAGAHATWNFTGIGNGHGVGLCQWGAKVMGERGHAMAQILKHYYPDSVLRKLW